MSDLYQSKPPSRVEAFRILQPLELAGAIPDPTLAPDASDSPAPLASATIAEEDLYDNFASNAAGSVAVNVRLSAPQIAALKQRVIDTLISRAEPGFGPTETGEAAIHLSAQDVITALVASTVNRFDDGHISHILTAVTVSAGRFWASVSFSNYIPTSQY